MPLFFITGISGSGKSSLCKELKRRGYIAYDTDDDGLARWQHNETGYIHPKSSVKSADRTAEFIKDHSWNVPYETLSVLEAQAEDKVVFVCGVVTNEHELRPLFHTVFALVIDEKTLVHRLKTRENNDWGKQPHELEQTLAAQHDAGEKYRKRGYVIIDATRPLETVADEILHKAI